MSQKTGEEWATPEIPQAAGGVTGPGGEAAMG